MKAMKGIFFLLSLFCFFICAAQHNVSKLYSHFDYERREKALIECVNNINKTNLVQFIKDLNEFQVDRTRFLDMIDTNKYGPGLHCPIISSIGPVIIVDNFSFLGNLEELNPDNIDTLFVLKGKPAVDVYGYRAINGVIIVQTKRGFIYNRYVAKKKRFLFFKRRRNR